ncbi:MAG: ATP-binding protein [Candidatus Dojkabacteria bacterium]|nr:ATP-binding protein [Candidatus Dojkabacteria bacterium]
MDNSNPKWYDHYSYLLNYDEVFETFFPGRHATNNDQGLHNDLIVITGKKGSGKTELAKMLAFIFSSVEKDRFVIFCGIPDLYSDLEEILGENRVLQIDLEEVEEEGDYTPPPVEMFKNIFIIFDDTEKHESKDIEKMLWRLMNAIAQKGRNYKTTLIVILHQLNKGLSSSTILREMDALIIFPKFFDMNTFNSIVHHVGIPKHIVEALYKIDEKFILIRNSAPQYFFLGTSMKKTNNFNEILKLAYSNNENNEENEGNEDNEINFLENFLNKYNINEKPEEIKENGEISGMPT